MVSVRGRVDQRDLMLKRGVGTSYRCNADPDQRRLIDGPHLTDDRRFPELLWKIDERAGELLWRPIRRTS